MGSHGGAEPGHEPADQGAGGYRQPRLPGGPHPLQQQPQEVARRHWTAFQVRARLFVLPNVMWIRILIRSVFSSLVDPYYEYVSAYPDPHWYKVRYSWDKLEIKDSSSFRCHYRYPVLWRRSNLDRLRFRLRITTFV